MRHESIVGLFSLSLDFDPLRVSVQGDMIRDSDGTNNSNSQSNRKTAHGDSDDEEQGTESAGGERSTMDIYRLRRLKRAKLTTTTSGNSTDQATAPVLT